VSQVEVSLASVISDVDLAVLTGIHGARIHIEIRVKFAHRDFKTTRLEESPERGSGESLS
jgi:hypothetical protein